MQCKCLLTTHGGEPPYLDSGSVLLKGVCRGTPWVSAVRVPDVDKVIVASTSQEPSVGRPLEPADVQGVGGECVHVELG